MIRINLLPHRAERRKAQQIQFAAFSAISIVLGVFVVGLVHMAISAQIDYQERRNAYLNKEIAVLDRQIDEIKKLREQTKSLLARKNVVENLQSTRSDIVHLMDQMLRILPEGVYLKSLKQNGNVITITGYAQSNARVSTLMRAIDDSPWLQNPVLVETRASTVKDSGEKDSKAQQLRVNEFQLTFEIAKGKSQTPDKGINKPSTPPVKTGFIMMKIDNCLGGLKNLG